MCIRDSYPRSLALDLERCESAGVDMVFAPTTSALYRTQRESDSPTIVSPPLAMTQVMCGRFRPGHFEGVATVVTKLLSLVKPDRAYFGRKDAQQLAIIRRLIQDLNLPGQVIGCPIIRELDGLALSSRNQYLAPAEREQAAVLYRGLTAAKSQFRQGQRQAAALISTVESVLVQAAAVQPQYVELVDPRTLTPLDTVKTSGLLSVAAHVGATRLIDNCLLRSRQPIIAIDGPAGAGKSTVARQVARRLGLLYLDSGAMYRAVTWLVLERGLRPQDEVAIAELIQDCELRLAPTGDNPEFAAYPSRIWINDQEVTRLIRSEAVTSQVSAIAAQPTVRQQLLAQQQQYGENGGVVMEGRDIGTQVFPEAELKIFLTASVEERARRRQRDMQAQNQPTASLEDLERAIDERDHKDSTRRVAPLRKASDAIELNTDGLTIEEVIDKIVALFHEHAG
ncbi:cytidylate kinase, partial [filamentous cyanobacterium CCP5]